MDLNSNLEIVEVTRLSNMEKLKYFFINPNKLFEDYKTRPTWLLKLLIIMAMAIAYTIIYSKFTLAPQIDLLIQQQPELTMEQAKASLQFFNSPIFLVVVAMIGSLITIFLTPFIYYGLISLFGGKTNYMRIVAVYSLAYIPYYIGELVNFAIAYYTNNYENLIQPQITDALLNRLGLFVIWQVLLLVFGFSKIADIKIHKAAIVVAIMWIIATGFTLVPVFMSRLF